MAETTEKKPKRESKAQKAHVSSEKTELVEKLAKEISKANTIMLVSIKNLPASQLQKMKKELRGKADIRVAKKSALIRAIEATGIQELQKLKDYVKEDSALLLSGDEGFELSGWFTENRSPINAKEGQIAEEDITIEEGPTDLVPGPVISELGSLGLQIMVEDGKITIRKSKVAVKKGDKITGNAASIFQKLGIKPFMIGIIPLAFYDSKSKKIYLDIKIDKKAKLTEIVTAKAKAFAMAVSLGYTSKDTIGMLLAKANSHMAALNKLQTKVQEVK